MKKATGYILISILMLLIGFGIAVCLFKTTDIFESKSKESAKKIEVKKTDDEDKKETLDADGDVVTGLFNQLLVDYRSFTNGAQELFINDKVTPTDLNEFYVYYIVDRTFGDVSEMTLDEWNDRVHKLFGEDYDMDLSFIENNKKVCSKHYYNAVDGKFEYAEPACGGTLAFAPILNKTAKAEVDNDQLTITVNVLFPDSDNELNDNGNVKYYKDYSRSVEITDLTYSTTEKAAEYYLPEDTEENYSKGGTYLLTFGKNADDSYYFISSEPVSVD